MDIHILGQYDFDNYTLLNVLMDENESINTAIHEYTHFVLSTQSIYGTIQYCLKKLIIPPDCQSDINKKKAAMDFFVDSTLKVQEGMAVFIEAIYFLLRDQNEYTCFIDELRKSNPKYYGYVKPFFFILEMIKEKERDTVLTVAYAVFQVALKSMNAEIYAMNGSSFGTTKMIKKMVSNQDFSKEFIPNKKFVYMIEDCKHVTSCEELIQELWNKAENEKTTDAMSELTERLEKVKAFVLDIFSESKYLDRYRNKLKEIEINEEESSKVFLQQIPTAFNEDYVVRNMKKIGFEILKHKCKTTDFSTLFILGRLKDNLSDLLKRMGIPEIQKENQDDREILFFYDLRNKEIYGCILEEKQLQEILSDNENKCVLLTSYKNFDYDGDCIPNHSDIKRFTYIYCDRTYSNASSIINKWKDRKVYYRYIVYDSMPVLLIKNSDNSMFILPMTPMVADEADRDIRNNRKNMLMITDVKDDEFDSHVITDSKKKDEIDTIINSLFFINMSPRGEE